MKKLIPAFFVLLLVCTLFFAVSCKEVQPETYQITYDANGSTGGSLPENQTKTQGLDLTLASTTGNLVRTGHIFVGWNTKADGSGTDYPAGSAFSVDAETTLYAKWVELPSLTFSSAEAFTLKTLYTTKNWDGSLEYSTDKATWTEWSGSVISAGSSGTNYVLYLRGTGNTIITGNSDSYKWVLTPTGTSNISCTGNIESLLDSAKVASGEHPEMGTYCYAYMFLECPSLSSAPELPATELTNCCYQYMFAECTVLTTAPDLPATTLADQCYQYMFVGCDSLTTAPDLPAATLAYYCYACMFQDCTSLVSAPALPATTLVDGCYRQMFEGCTSIKLSATRIGEYQTLYCIPIAGTVNTTATNALYNMFLNTGGTFTETPTINTNYYTSNTVVSAI